jgi:hypothetical protein
MVSLPTDFNYRPDKDQSDMLKSSLRVFIPSFVEEESEPLDVTEVEYIKLEHAEGDEYVNPNQPTEKFAYTPEMGLLRL